MAGEEAIFGIYGLEKGVCHVARLEPPPPEANDLERSEYSRLHELLFRQTVTPEREAEIVSFSYEPDQAIEAVDNGEAQLAIIMRPVPMDEFMAIVTRGWRLPPKPQTFIQSPPPVQSSRPSKARCNPNPHVTLCALHVIPSPLNVTACTLHVVPSALNVIPSPLNLIPSPKCHSEPQNVIPSEAEESNPFIHNPRLPQPTHHSPQPDHTPVIPGNDRNPPIPSFRRRPEPRGAGTRQYRRHIPSSTATHRNPTTPRLPNPRSGTSAYPPNPTSPAGST